MEVLELNLRVHQLELDIVARDGNVIAIIEVRTRGRGSWAKALASVDGRKRERLRRAAKLLWARRFSKMADVQRMRFDVVAVDLDHAAGVKVEYVRAAFV